MPDPSSGPVSEAYPWLRSAWEAALAIVGSLLAILAAIKSSSIVRAIKVLFGVETEHRAPSPPVHHPHPPAHVDPYSIAALGRLEARDALEREERAYERLLASIQKMADSNARRYADGLRPLLDAVTRLDAAHVASGVEVEHLRELVAEVRGLVAEARTARHEITGRLEQIQRLAETLASIYQELGELPDFPTAEDAGK